MTVAKEEVKKGSFIRTLIIILMAFIALPLITMGIMYFTNESFNDNANKILSTLPGNMGGYFRSIPTKPEKEEVKRNIAKYYVELDENRIVDKLLIIKGEDDQLYNELVILMSKENPNKMKSVKENLKLLNFKEDSISRILSEIDTESQEKINSLQKYYTSLPLAKGVDEIERTYASNEISADELAKLFQNLKPDQASKYLFYLDEEIGRQIKYKLPNESLRNIEKKIQEFEANQQKLLNLALEYENKSLGECVEELGNLNKYSLEELAVIFKNLSLNKSSKILSKVDNNDFMLMLFESINHLQQLKNEVPSISPTILKGIGIYKGYDEKTSELAAIYEKTSVDELAKMLEIMLKRNEIYQRHTLTDSEEIIFTEELLVVDVLNKLKYSKTAEILGMMNESTKIMLSKKLVN